MAVVIKSKNYAVLKAVQVPPEVIAELEAKGIKLGVGSKDVSFIHPVTNAVLSVVPLTVPAQDLLKGSGTISNQAPLLAGAKMALAGAAPAKAPAKTTGWAPAAKINPASVLSGEALKVAKVATPINLRDATTLYQRVNGSSPGSIYVVVACNANIKVAARLLGTKISVRVEMSASDPAAVKAFEEQGMFEKGGYLSGHYICSSAEQTSRVMGAVLLGSGIAFDTPLPDMKVVGALGS